MEGPDWTLIWIKNATKSQTGVRMRGSSRARHVLSNAKTECNRGNYNLYLWSPWCSSCFHSLAVTQAMCPPHFGYGGGGIGLVVLIVLLVLLFR
jgi:hypothetical protein